MSARQWQPSLKPRKPYEKPTVTQLTPEHAKLRLLGHASMGNRGAMELLEMMFPEAHPKTPKKAQPEIPTKKSA
jgi:hypothetical protein